VSTKAWYRDVARSLEEMGITHEFQPGKKHTKVWIQKGEKKGLLVISASPSDTNSLALVKAQARRLVW
jgi:hypothetical protein